MSTINNSIMLDVQNLNKRFGGVHAVRDLSFQIKKGEIFGFLGPNGAGKSTTMRILTCFIPATSGSVKIDGLDTVEHSLDIRKKIGYLPESAPLYNDMIVDEYLLFVGKLRGLRGTTLTSSVDKMIQTCSLQKMTKRQIGKLSKGFRQRVGLAQAMIHNPELLILDEPMSGLDPNQIIEIRELIKNVGAEKTVIYCSHILPEVAATCSRILIINDGTPVASGTPEELTAKNSSGSIYNLTVKGSKEAIKTELGKIPSVSSVGIADEENDEWLKVTISSNDKADIGENIFNCIVSNKFVLTELKREETSLEDVFTQLTRG